MNEEVVMVCKELLVLGLMITAQKTGIDVEKIRGKSRNGRIPDARHIWFYCMGRYGFSDKQIAGFVNRDRTSVISGIKKVENIMSYSNDFRQAVKDLEDNIYDCKTKYLG